MSQSEHQDGDDQTATRKHFYLITEAEDDDRVGLIKISDSRHSRGEKNVETPFHKFNEESGDFYVAGKQVSMGYYDFESQEAYEDEDTVAEVTEQKLGEIDDEHLRKAGHDPEEVHA